MVIKGDFPTIDSIKSKIQELTGSKWSYAGCGSERGYIHVGEVVFSGVVSAGKRFGLFKVQLPRYRGSTQYVRNLYFRHATTWRQNDLS